MRKKEQIRDLLVKALRLLNNKDNSWHLYYRPKLIYGESGEPLYKVAAFLESPDGFTIESQSITIAVNIDWQLNIEGLQLCLNLYLQQPIMPIDDPLTIHTSSDAVYALLSEVKSKVSDFEALLKLKNLDKVTDRVVTGFAYLVRLLPEVNLELE